MRIVLLAVIASLTLSGPLSGQEARGTRSDSAAAAAIRARRAPGVEQTKRGDRRAAQTIWAPGSVCWFPRAALFGDTAAAGVAGLPTVPSGGYSTYLLVIDEVAVGGAIAAVHDRWTETRHFPGTTATARRLIRGSELWRRQPDGSWRIARCVSAPEAWEREAGG
jgi:hypothetical protein